MAARPVAPAPAPAESTPSGTCQLLFDADSAHLMGLTAEPPPDALPAWLDLRLMSDLHRSMVSAHAYIYRLCNTLHGGGEMRVGTQNPPDPQETPARVHMHLIQAGGWRYLMKDAIKHWVDMFPASLVWGPPQVVGLGQRERQGGHTFQLRPEHRMARTPCLPRNSTPSITPLTKDA